MNKNYLCPDLQPVRRVQACSLCTSMNGFKVAHAAFWDLQSSNIVQCGECLHIQLDPKLSQSATAKGCFAYYKRELQAMPLHEEHRNHLRNFRRGVLFGRTLRKAAPQIQSVLEFGPGDGFFLQGLRFACPRIKITVLDIVEEVLIACRQTHGYETLLGSPDSQENFTTETFDLIIARDVIEHVNDIPQMFVNLKKLLRPNGLFHFLTPNGYEDVWGHAMLWALEGKTSELLINHVNYFEGTSLQDYLAKHGFEPLSYYTYKFKDFFKGKGRIKSLKWSRAQNPIVAQEFIDAPSANTSTKTSGHSAVQSIYNVWYVTPRVPWLTYLVSAYHHFDLFRVSPPRNVGHEIFGLFRRSETPAP